MKRGFGIEERSARDQIQRTHPPAKAEPLPEPYAPAKVDPGALGITDPGSELSFFVLGDVGGVKVPTPQNAVSAAMEHDLENAAFALILGDVVYFNGQQMGLVDGRQTGYGDQFYEPYAKFARPIIAFPGNHDGEAESEKEASLAGFMENFCQKTPGIPVDDPQLEFGRHTQTLPYCEWTLDLKAVTIIAVYTNVPSGGHLEPAQIERLTRELKEADPEKPLIVGLHHPPYSVDAHHGGSPRMAQILDQAIEQSKRVPELVLSGHVHDYQRFTRTIEGKQVPFIVSGNGGYHNLHKLAKDATPGEELAEDVVFEFGDASRYGFLKLTVKQKAIEGEYIAVTPGTMPDGSDAQIEPGQDKF
jgi:predicted MPP superfamily phosphohydrolase